MAEDKVLSTEITIPGDKLAEIKEAFELEYFNGEVKTDEEVIAKSEEIRKEVVSQALTTLVKRLRSHKAANDSFVS